MRLVRVALLVALVFPCAACAFSKKHDYMSLNRASWSFLKDTYKQSRKLRKESWRNMDLSDAISTNLKRQREQRRFSYQSAVVGLKLNWKETWGHIWRARKIDWKYRRAQIRFGFLDGGD